MRPLRTCWQLIAFALLAMAASHAADDNVVALPPFIVEESAKGPPWRYAEVDGMEILSRCTEPATRELIDTYIRLHRLLAEILPESLQLKLTVPKTFIFYDRAQQPAASQEVIAQMMKSSGGGAMPPENFAPSGRNFRGMPSPTRYSFLPNLRLWDRDAMAVFSIMQEGTFDGDRLGLTADYIAYLVKSRIPMLPPWFTSGFLALYSEVKFDGNELTIPQVQWISQAATAALKKDPTTAPHLLPLGAFFAGDLSQRESPEVDPLRLWQSQAALFVRWGFEGKDLPRRAALWKFAERCARDLPSEELFRECFDMDYATAHAEMTAFLPRAVRTSATIHLPRLARVPANPIRVATEVEISRIKGDWERMEIAYVRARFPQVAQKYLEQARRTLMRAYDHDSRDPRLLEVMGLCEIDGGNDAGALDFLEEAAARSKTLRPRAWYELARLRYAQMRAPPAIPDGRLTAAQAARVLDPLFATRRMDPPLPEVYELIADVWAQCAAPPTRGHIAVVEEGVRLFPWRTDLVYRGAKLDLQYGYRDEASWLVSIGLKFARDDAARKQFILLEESLGNAGKSP